MQHVKSIRFRRFLICCLVLDHPVAFTFGRLSPNLHFHDLDLDSHTCAFFPRPLPKENFTVSLLLV
jgi:hypothetical protein